MRNLGPGLLIVAALLGLAFVLLVPDWRLPGGGTQLGYRAQSMIQFAPTAAEAAARRPAPLVIPAVPDDARPASGAFHNVKVLTDVNAGDFMRLQYAITAWVSPKQGCGYCHVAGDYASDAKPPKQAAREMLTMVRHINGDWASHVGAAGVTCQTCHRGQPVPSTAWFQSPPQPQRRMIDRSEDWQEPALTVREFFPYEGYEEYLVQDTPGLGQSYTALPSGEVQSPIAIKRLYEAMMQMSDGIGVNCGFCHESRAFFDWRQSTPERWTGYSGIKMTRDLNRNYLLKLGAIIPENRSRPDDNRSISLPPRFQGPQSGNGLVDCATCHHGAPKPAGVTGLVPSGLAPRADASAQAALSTAWTGPKS